MDALLRWSPLTSRWARQRESVADQIQGARPDIVNSLSWLVVMTPKTLKTPVIERKRKPIFWCMFCQTYSETHYAATVSLRPLWNMPCQHTSSLLWRAFAERFPVAWITLRQYNFVPRKQLPSFRKIAKEPDPLKCILHLRRYSIKKRFNCQYCTAR